MRYRPQGYTRAVCPYYITDSRLTISCEACERAGEKIKIEFSDPDEKTDFLRKNCCVHQGFWCFYRMAKNLGN